MCHSRTIVRVSLLLGLLGMLGGPFASAQGLLLVNRADGPAPMPRPIVLPTPTPPPSTYRIQALDIHAKLQDQVAQVQISQKFQNTGSQPLEVSFVFPLPYDGAIDRLTLMVDGKEFPAKMLPAEEARRLYEDIVRTSRDPALLEWMGTGLYRTSVFPVPPGGVREVVLRYTQLCRKNDRLTDFLLPLSTAKYTSQPLDTLAIDVAVESTAPLKNLYSPTHAVDVRRQDDHHAVVAYRGTNLIPTDDFRLFYDVSPQAVGATLLSYRPRAEEDGYLLLLASPEIKPPDQPRAPKTILFVCDRSGSMSGPKIEQAKAALRFVLENLREGDLFNIIAYDSQVELFRPELQRWDATSRDAALGYVAGLYAGGSTNLDGALVAALGQLKDSARPSYVIFLTDGLPTEGEQSEAQIAAHARAANQVHARVFTFGVGYDVNSRLLDRIGREHAGQSHYVRPDESIEAHVASLYRRIESPVLTGVAVDFQFDGLAPADPTPVSRRYPTTPYDLFEGDQLVLVARYRRAGAAQVRITGQLAGQPAQFDYPVQLVAKSDDANYAFVEKLWALRRVGEIIDELDLKGKNEELVKELVELATRHGIMTPYTAFLADESTDLRQTAQNTARADLLTDRLAESAGTSGVAQRAQKSALQAAGGGFGFSTLAGPGAPALRDEQDREVQVSTCRQVGGKTFYRRQARWVDASITPDQQRHARRIEQFSPEFFALVATYGRAAAQCLALNEPLLVNLGEQCYEIVPPTR